jgi:S-adenosylmethionine:tRNA ribosyltransferase-isomerase
MQLYKQINISDYDYNLPDQRIAKYPLDKRDSSKLLIGINSKFSQSSFANITDYLPENSLIVFNDTKVIKARLHFAKETGSQIEIFCLEPLIPADYSMSLSSTNSCSWKCLVGNNKKWKTGILIKDLVVEGITLKLCAERIQQFGNAFEILFSWNNSQVCFAQILEAAGNIPIPPYLNRESESIDESRYQTIYGQNQGSVAAPTAGLHFTDNVFKTLNDKNIKTDKVTLHVGAGTFQPVKAEFILDHEMHTEHFNISRENINLLKIYLGNISVVGTTTVRTLESFYQIALQIWRNPEKLDNNFTVTQWEAYENDFDEINTAKLLQNVIVWMDNNGFNEINCATSIMIVPGYKFRFTNRLITNFHQPKSTLLLLLAAFTGNSWKDAYKFAMENDFRFLSYGDSCLFIK